MRRVIAAAALVVALSACSPQEMLYFHRAANPDPNGPYARANCESPAESRVGHWACPEARVNQLRAEARYWTRWWNARL